MLIEKPLTGSTNDDAREWAAQGAPHGAAVLAQRQTAGRGRAGREWASPNGGLYLSVVLRLRAPPTEWGMLPLALGAAAARVLRAHGAPVGVKWPNDLLVGEDKLGGILIEARFGDGVDQFAIAGLGLNLEDAPVEGATALARHVAPPMPPLRELAEALRLAFVQVADALDEGKSEQLRQGVRETCVSLGKNVEWEEGGGVAVDVDVDGALLVESAGQRHRVVAGDVRLRWSPRD